MPTVDELRAAELRRVRRLYWLSRGRRLRQRGEIRPVPVAQLLQVASANLIAYYPLNETTGTTADNAEGTAARDGTYTNVTLDDAVGKDNLPVASWDGSTSYARINTANFLGAFDETEGSFSVWFKPSDMTTWDGATKRRVCHFGINTANVIYLQKSAANRLDFGYSGGGVGATVSIRGVTSANWQHATFTWSVAADEIKGYLDGGLQDTATGLGTFAGAITQAVIGSNESAPSLVWDGNIQHLAIWDTPLTANQPGSLIAK